ncbi:hypothetical protein OsJ_07493 [Oryza sativa Japonica Group]|uniref:Uncharacterized protein n=1 Tax=Oryza sativa subsp. japonica TaxID=39947 RepID=B9F114_ORYSJ|nr:hypothetical protein OsJ_07493 [Oryza sativa Japonica Group]
MPWSGRVRSFAGAGEGAGAAAVPACPAPRRGGGKKPSSAPSPSSTVATAPAHPSGRPFEEYVKEWKAKKAALGVPAGRCELPFLTGTPKAKKRPDSRAEAGCTNCSADSTCKDDCECRGLYMSCSKNCHCSDMCTNKPFRKDKKIKAVKTKRCGWGAISLEPLEKGDFIIEYVGEVINDATCEQRLWDMKRRGDKNFYMCEISKDFTIDATFKGNTSRFLNHSCDPNCKLEKWQVDGETRVGVFASRSIQVGEHLTYDYRFVHFGEKVKCYCGAQNCQGYLGNQIKNPTQRALAIAALENEWLESLKIQQDTSASRHKPMTHLLPWTNCIEVPFNLRSKRKIHRICWGCKRRRSAVAVTSPTSIQASVTEAAAAAAAASLPALP